MTTIQRAIQVLCDAEAALKRLIAEAAEHGEYSSVETLAQWASSLGVLSQKERPAAQPCGTPAPAVSKSPAPPRAATRRKVSTKKTTPTRRRDYPVFAKSGDTLVKIGWSKSAKAEYQHKSPRAVAGLLATSLALQAKAGTIVSMDQVLPLKAEDGSEIPDYQVYVSLAWFRQIGVIEQNGRQGYTVNAQDDLTRAVDAAWSNLPEAGLR